MSKLPVVSGRDLCKILKKIGYSIDHQTGSLFLAWKRGYSPLEIFSAKADQAFVETLRRRFSQPNIS